MQLKGLHYSYKKNCFWILMQSRFKKMILFNLFKSFFNVCWQCSGCSIFWTRFISSLMEVKNRCFLFLSYLCNISQTNDIKNKDRTVEVTLELDKQTDKQTKFNLVFIGQTKTKTCFAVVFVHSFKINIQFPPQVQISLFSRTTLNKILLKFSILFLESWNGKSTECKLILI